MENNHIPIIEYNTSQCTEIAKGNNTINCTFLKPTDIEINSLLGKPVYLTLDGTWLGCFILEKITHLEGNNSQLQYINIEATPIKNNQLLTNQLESIDNYPFTISGFEEGSISYCNLTNNELLCFPLIGYQQWPLSKPTNLPIDLLPPAVRINPLLQKISTALGIAISPLSEELVLPYFGNKPILWPWQTLAAISFEASNGLGLSFDSELNSIIEAHTTIAKVYKTTFLSNYTVQVSVTLTLENNGNSTNTGLFYINITDPSQVLLKHEAIINYEVEANSNQTYTLNLEGAGITNDLITITLVPDNSCTDLSYNIVGEIIPQTNEGILINQLIEEMVIGKLFQLIEKTTGKQWQWNDYKNCLELTTPVETTFYLGTLSNATNTNSTKYLPQFIKNGKVVQVNKFNQYLHVSTVNTVAIQLPSTKNMLPNPSETINYSQPVFLVKVPETTQVIGVEGYQVTSFVPEIINYETEESAFTKTIVLEAEIHVHEIGNLLKANSFGFEQSIFNIKELMLKPKQNGFISLKLNAIA
jgi:hypothetical protein